MYEEITNQQNNYSNFHMLHKGIIYNKYNHTLQNFTR